MRIAFLTTDATASASEININAMRAWVEVAIVGSDTYGKPVGQLAFDLANACQDRLRLVTFKTVNAHGQATTTTGSRRACGFACAASDTLDAPMGDPADGLTQAALQWINTGACASVIDCVRRRPGQDQPGEPVPAAAATVCRRALAARHRVTRSSAGRASSRARHST